MSFLKWLPQCQIIFLVVIQTRGWFKLERKDANLFLATAGLYVGNIIIRLFTLFHEDYKFCLPSHLFSLSPIHPQTTLPFIVNS